MGKAYIDISTEVLEKALELPRGCYVVGNEHGHVRLTFECSDLPMPREDGSLRVARATITKTYKTWKFDVVDA